MSFRVGGDDDREEGDEERLFGGVSEADEKDHFPDGGGAGDQDDRHRMFVLRRMNSDSTYDMSSMTAQQLPAKKKGLSRHYEGRSQSFACMSGVQCLEDLQKKDSPYKQKIKACNKSYAALRGMGKTTKPSSNSYADLNIVATNAPPFHVNRNGYHR